MPVYSLCGGLGSNTGPVACDKRRGIPEVLLLGGKTFTPNEYGSSTTFQAAILAAINLPNGDADKLYPFPIIQDVKNNTEQNTVGTTGKGFRMILKEGKPSYTFGVLAGSTQEKNMRKFNNQILPVFVFDNLRDVDGMLDGNQNFVGQQALIFCDGKPYSNGSDIDSEYTNVEVSFLSATDFHDNYAFRKTTLSVTALEGLLDAALYQTQAPVTNVFKIGAKCITPELGKVYSFYTKYADELAAAALWIAKTGINFLTDLPITSVAKDDASGGWSITFDAAIYNALPANTQILVSLASPAVLLPAGVRGIEGVPLILTKAA